MRKDCATRAKRNFRAGACVALPIAVISSSSRFLRMKPENSFFVSCPRALRAVLGLATVGFIGGSLFAQDAAQRPDGERRRGAPDGERRTFNPADMQARMMSTLRERMGVTSDEEWAVIAERITKVSELRRQMGGGLGAAMAMRGPSGSGGGDSGRSRGRPGGSAETEALTSAVRDQLPEAELKARMAKLRETRKANEKKLEEAQEELRAVLTVRQEAMLVIAGILP